MKLQRILEILAENSIQFVIVGGVALNIHGSDRVTFDSDIVIRTINKEKSGININDLDFRVLSARTVFHPDL